MPHLQFKGKSAVETYHHTVPHHTFEFDPKLSVLDKGQLPGVDGNLIIEGDNLLALKALLPTHAGKVKCIYIDPPYNTGNEGWVYNDNLTQPQFKEWIGQTVGKEGEDFCRHDKWCCMMYPRLQLLKELLREDGVIAISIGDDEVAHLRMLLDEIYGGHNFIAHIVWQKRYVSNATAMYLSDMHDHLMVFGRDASKVVVNRIERTQDQLKAYQNPDNDPRGPWRAQDLSASKTYKAGVFTITGPHGDKFNPPPRRYWRCNREQYNKWLSEDRITFGKDGKSRPMRKSFLSETSDGVTPNTWWDFKFAGHNKEAKLELKKLFGGEAPFDTPKPVKLIERITDLFCADDSIVLDSFSGSGTTGHAVLANNSSAKNQRRFILIQQGYDTKEDEQANINITRTVTQPRISKVIQGTKDFPGLGGTFAYARLSDKPLFGDYRDLGDKLPGYDDIAAYVFYTETSTQWSGSDKRKNKAFDKKTGRIGEHGGRSYYLLYQPNAKLDAGLDATFLKDVAAKDPNRELVVYCEKLWVHRDHLRAWEREHGKRIRPMIVPFNLK